MNNILNNFNFNNYIVVGVSSGPDSMCLLNILEEKTNKIIICHINHNVRKQSKKEERFLREYSKMHNLIFETMTIEKYEENNFENEARKKRYAFYEEILKKYNSKYLFLAHHGDDLIETILMKIMRGSNLEGYAGIKEVSKVKNYEIIRPLLNFTKNDILEYNKLHNIIYFIDSSNQNTKYTRNRYRKNILPLLKKEDTNAHLKFLNFSKTLQEYDYYIKNIIKDKVTNIYINNCIDLKEFNNLDAFLKKNILFYIMNDVYNNECNIVTEKQINNILSLINNKKPNLILNLPKKITIIKEYNKLYIKNTTINDKDYKIKFNNSLTINNLFIEKVRSEKTDGNSVCRIDSKNIKLPLYFRNKKDGDYIILKTSKNKKKIKEIFIEKKLPIRVRNNYPLLVDSNDNIIWIPNIKKSEFCIKKEGKYDIIIKCNEREEFYE